MFAEAIAYIAMQRSVPLTSTSGPNVIIVVVIIIIICNTLQRLLRIQWLVITRVSFVGNKLKV